MNSLFLQPVKVTAPVVDNDHFDGVELDDHLLPA
tara:strand:- start:107 stop:208 length:102 start_codon:yes stop_codon:yes gene_type:complete